VVDGGPYLALPVPDYSVVSKTSDRTTREASWLALDAGEELKFLQYTTNGWLIYITLTRR
jgi:hypothetical protein